MGGSHHAVLCPVVSCGLGRPESRSGAASGACIRRLVNLHERRHLPRCLGAYALTESHVPVADFAAPTRAQLATALGVIHAAVSAGERVAVHCGAQLASIAAHAEQRTASARGAV
jgi:hypothetical protein